MEQSKIIDTLEMYQRIPLPPHEHDDDAVSPSDPAMYTSPGRTYTRVGVRDPARMYVRGRIYFLATWLYVHVHATCVSLL